MRLRLLEAQRRGPVLGGKEAPPLVCLDRFENHMVDPKDLDTCIRCGAKWHDLGLLGGYWTPPTAVC